MYENNRKFPGDINEHLETLKKYADTCETVLELGHRKGCSASAFLMSKADLLHSVDIMDCRSWHNIRYQLDQDPEWGPSFEFFQEDALLWKPPMDYDLVFIDDLHEGNHLLQELNKYAPIANKWIILHDTEAFAWEGEQIPQGASKGLRWALINFLLSPDGECWNVWKHYPNNNGLTILKRFNK
jgi:hypothetical protein